MKRTDKSQNKSFFWSYAEIPTEKNTVIEHTLKYADIEEIKDIISRYGVDDCIKVWHKTMLHDARYRKMNFFLAKFIFQISLYDSEISAYINKNAKSRAERINELFNH